MERAAALVEAGVDCLFVDTAHGHSAGVIETTGRIRAAYPDLPLCSGNVVTREATLALIDAGADG
jgi:IMP dehydrogenase